MWEVSLRICVDTVVHHLYSLLYESNELDH